MSTISCLVDHLVAAAQHPETSFSLAYQPIFDTSTGEVTSVEALVRWTLDGTEISTSIFIPIIESLGLVPTIDRFVLRTASAAAASWPTERRLSVNFSSLSFGLPDLENLILKDVEAAGLSHSRLTIELTETALAAMPKKLFNTLKRLVAGGFSIALDDFGAGQTSLAQLRYLPLRTLKIDRSLVRGAATDRRAIAILTAITNLGASLGIVVVAEGIETEAEFALMKELGIPRMQGFLFSPPVALPDLEASIAAGTKQILACPVAGVETLRRKAGSR